MEWCGLVEGCFMHAHTLLCADTGKQSFANKEKQIAVKLASNNPYIVGSEAILV
jgi:hypothetical protein